jgi:5-methylcytosine-specific restriction endonuclease McrA
MSRGVPTDGLWRGRAPLAEWLRHQSPRPCACGCGGLVLPKKEHRHRPRAPRYLQGHHSRVAHPNYKGVDAWVRAHQGMHTCGCGCGGIIGVRPRHHSRGIPRYVHGHQPPPPNPAGPEHPAFIADRSRVRARGGMNFSREAMKEIFRQCGGRCVRCDHDRDIEYDHVVPVFAGGRSDASNGQLLCKDCHRLKSRFERAMDHSGDSVLRFLRSLRAFLENAHKEVSENGNSRNTAHLPQEIQIHRGN